MQSARFHVGTQHDSSRTLIFLRFKSLVLTVQSGTCPVTKCTTYVERFYLASRSRSRRLLFWRRPAFSSRNPHVLFSRWEEHWKPAQNIHGRRGNTRGFVVFVLFFRGVIVKRVPCDLNVTNSSSRDHNVFGVSVDLSGSRAVKRFFLWSQEKNDAREFCSSAKYLPLKRTAGAGDLVSLFQRASGGNVRLLCSPGRPWDY